MSEHAEPVREDEDDLAGNAGVTPVAEGVSEERHAADECPCEKDEGGESRLRDDATEQADEGKGVQARRFAPFALALPALAFAADQEADRKGDN